MVGHGRGALERLPVVQIGRDADCPERVIPDLGGDPGRQLSLLDHRLGIGLGQGGLGELLGS